MPHRPGVLSSKAAFYLLASMMVSFLAGSSAPTPLYRSTRRVGLLADRHHRRLRHLRAGRARRAAGRRLALRPRRPAPGAARGDRVQAASMLVFATAGGVGRAARRAHHPGPVDRRGDRRASAPACSTSTAEGRLANAVGAADRAPRSARLVGGLLVQFLPAPTHLVYLVLGGVFVLQGVGVALMAETNPPRGGALASLRPQFALPAAARRPLLLPSRCSSRSGRWPASTASLGPRLVHAVFGLDSSLLGGLALFVLAASGGVDRAGPAQVDRAARSTLGAAMLLGGRRRRRGARRAVGGAGSSSARRSPASVSAPASRGRCAPSCRWPRRTNGPACWRSCTSCPTSRWPRRRWSQAGRSSRPATSWRPRTASASW